MKFNIKKLYGGRLNDVMTPNNNGNKKQYRFWLIFFINFFYKICLILNNFYKKNW